MDHISTDAAFVRYATALLRPRPPIPGGRANAPSTRDQLHSSTSEIPAFAGGYLHVRSGVWREGR